MLGHHHHHSGECDHEHDEQADRLQQERDPAAKSMADALRLSFRLLTVLMLGIVVLFAFTGLKQVQSGEVGVKSVLGHIVGVAGEGLQYTWPFPIGQIETVPVRQQTLEVHDFWMFETAEDKTLELPKRVVRDAGLRPGLDGALLTGDSYLIHMDLSCTYRVTDVLAFKRTAMDANGATAVHDAIATAAIRCAAMRTAEQLMDGQEQDKFKNDVREQAQAILDKLPAGITLSMPNLVRSTWPLRALAQYEAAQRAGQQAESEKEKARNDAGAILTNTCGPNYVKLVGEPWRADAAASADPNAEYDLIGKYESARKAGVPAAAANADAILQRINEILVSQATTGEVAKLMSAAGSYKTRVNQDVMSRVKRFEQLLPEYIKAPQFLMEREWMQTRQDILNSPNVVKWMWTFGKQKTVIEIKTPPEIERELRNASVRAMKADANNPGR